MLRVIPHIAHGSAVVVHRPLSFPLVAWIGFPPRCVELGVCLIIQVKVHQIESRDSPEIKPQLLHPVHLVDLVVGAKALPPGAPTPQAREGEKETAQPRAQHLYGTLISPTVTWGSEEWHHSIAKAGQKLLAGNEIRLEPSVVLGRFLALDGG